MEEEPMKPAADRLEELLTRKAGPSKARERAIDWKPLGDVKESPGEYTIFVDLPGVDEDRLLIEFQNQTLSISGERDFDHDREDAEEFSRINRPYGRFRFETDLQPPVDVQNVRAKYKRGVLKITVPRTEPLSHLQLEVD
jgi:HSP20 family protein